jgi:hypothetical protein
VNATTPTGLLQGTEWLLRTRVRLVHPGQADATLNREVVLRATYDTRTTWNAEFWLLFPATAYELQQQLVTEDGVSVSLDFPFHPTVALKKLYGPYSAFRIGRIADNWHATRGEKSSEIRDAVEAYRRDKARLDEQKTVGWNELLALRLPSPPLGYYWELTSNKNLSTSVPVTFRLWAKRMGAMPEYREINQRNMRFLSKETGRE